MMTDGQHEGEEDDETLWRLLGRAAQPRPVSPYFARRVLREVAALGEAPASVRPASPWLTRLWQACRRPAGVGLAGALAAVALTMVGGLHFFPTPRTSPAVPLTASQPGSAPTIGEGNVPVDPVAVNDPVAPAAAAPASEPVVTAQDVEVIADLDNVLSREESRLWTEDDNTTARF